MEILNRKPFQNYKFVLYFGMNYNAYQILNYIAKSAHDLLVTIYVYDWRWSVSGGKTNT